MIRFGLLYDIQPIYVNQQLINCGNAEGIVILQSLIFLSFIFAVHLTTTYFTVLKKNLQIKSIQDIFAIIQYIYNLNYVSRFII